VAGDPCALPAAQALRMATWNGAQALGLERSIGSIEVGKQADLVAIDLGDLRARPVYDPVSQIVYSAHRDQVTQVWVAGRHVVRNRQLATLDVLGLKASAEEWGQKLL
jgi:5-methylthioadenosine/S-adenosylhomocysteine deaminase